uniref:BART domain-containing protein n=1 Tax=Haptolina ericina TaxID=156174 RepID=A0A7S3AGP2_9EUKA
MQMTSLVDVTVPARVAAGQEVEFAFGTSTLRAVVPDGVSEGMVFQVEVAEASGEPEVVERLLSYVDSRASSGDIMDRFVAWFERERIEEAFEAFVATHAHVLSSSGGVEGEQDHAWWPLYQEYSAIFEGFLEKFLCEAGCTADEFGAAAQGASGMNEIYLQIFLAQSEYTMFVELLTMEAQKQRDAGT